MVLAVFDYIIDDLHLYMYAVREKCFRTMASLSNFSSSTGVS